MARTPNKKPVTCERQEVAETNETGMEVPPTKNFLVDLCFILMIGVIAAAYVAYRMDVQIVINNEPFDCSTPEGGFITMLLTSGVALLGKFVAAESLSLINQVKPLAIQLISMRFRRSPQPAVL